MVDKVNISFYCWSSLKKCLIAKTLMHKLVFLSVCVC